MHILVILLIVRCIIAKILQWFCTDMVFPSILADVPIIFNDVQLTFISTVVNN